MYRLVLYGLIVISAYAILCGFLGVLDYDGLRLVYSLILSLGVCYSVNWVLSKLFKAAVNVESWMITGLIIFCLFMPAGTLADALTFVYAGVIAMASKYVMAIGRRHIFNPAAIAAVLLSVNPYTVAFWWVGTPVMLPVVAAVGFLVVRKIRKFSMFFVFVCASIVGTFLFGILSDRLSSDIFVEMVLSGPLFFFGTIMLTEPLTMPPTRRLQMAYGGLVGVLSTLQFNIGALYSSPELALVVGNIFAYFVSPKEKLFLSFKRRTPLAKDTFELVLTSTRKTEGGESITPSRWRHKPGQYMEWTLPHSSPDSRGVRRYFTVASSPTEHEMKLGVKIEERASSFKRKLLSVGEDSSIIASHIGGDFVLPGTSRRPASPEEIGKKLVFIAGGIGVTPFRSMVKYLIDRNENRDIVLFYFNKTEDEIAYRDIFEDGKEVGVKSVFVLTDKERVPSGWKGEVGRLDEKMLGKHVPDFKERVFYISGPNAMVDGYKRILFKAGVKRVDVKTDYFPGF
jgi:ferredoxin-NADP reductase